MVFLDGPNFELSQRDYNSKYGKAINIDIIKMRSRLLGKRELVASLYFDSLYPTGVSEEKDRFYDFLIAIGFELKFSNLNAVDIDVADPDRTGEKGVDVNLAVEMVSRAYEDEYDTAILISGDGDYYNAVAKVITEREKQVEVVSFKDPCSKIFFDIVPDVTYLDDLIDEIKR
jgi:uncharacterized LabA/DUF88 family protein